MATKRSAPPVHPSRSQQVPEEPSQKRRKPNPSKHDGAKIAKKAHPVNDLKKRVRSLNRQLERSDIRADIRVEKERALQSAEHELAENQQAQRRSEMIGRWHKVRFFDRQKAMKRVKRARKEASGYGEGTEEKRLAQERMRDAEVKVNYAMYYPLDVAYVSLFPRKKSDGEADEREEGRAKEVERQGDAQMWERVKQCMADGTLDALRRGWLTQTPKDDDQDEQLALAKKKKKKAKEEMVGSKAKPGNAGEASEEESDGGFFE